MNNRKRKLPEEVQSSEEQKTPYTERELPLKAKPISNLEITPILEINVLGNTHFSATKKNHAEEKHNPTKYYYKKYQDSNLTQLEAYSASTCRLLAGEEYVPSTTIYYDNNEMIHGVASKDLKDFQSLHENPLRAEDMEFSILSIQKQYQKNILMSQLILPQKNGHSTKRPFAPQNILDLNIQV